MSASLPSPTGAVYDRGYRPYEGERGGRGAARAALVRISVRRALGLRRSWRQKVLPWTLLAIATVPAIVNVGVEVHHPQHAGRRLRPDHLPRVHRGVHHAAALRGGHGARHRVPRPAQPGPAAHLRPPAHGRRLRARQGRGLAAVAVRVRVPPAGRAVRRPDVRGPARARWRTSGRTPRSCGRCRCRSRCSPCSGRRSRLAIAATSARRVVGGVALLAIVFVTPTVAAILVAAGGAEPRSHVQRRQPVGAPQRRSTPRCGSPTSCSSAASTLRSLIGGADGAGVGVVLVYVAIVAGSLGYLALSLPERRLNAAMPAPPTPARAIRRSPTGRRSSSTARRCGSARRWRSPRCPARSARA